MKRSERMTRLVHLQSLKEKQKARSVALIRQQLTQAQAQQFQLESYHGEYRQNLENRGVQGMSGLEFTKYCKFIQQIAQLMVVQEKRVEESAFKLRAFQEAWFKAFRQLNVYEQIEEKMLQTEEMELDKKEQKEQDDRSCFLKFNDSEDHLIKSKG